MPPPADDAVAMLLLAPPPNLDGVVREGRFRGAARVAILLLLLFLSHEGGNNVDVVVLLATENAEGCNLPEQERMVGGVLGGLNRCDEDKGLVVCCIARKWKKLQG